MRWFRRYQLCFFGKCPFQRKWIQSALTRNEICLEESAHPESITTIFAKRPRRPRQAPRFRSSLRIGATAVTGRKSASSVEATIEGVTRV